MSVTAIKALSYGLPTISVLFTWWLPAGLQLSFFISGIASYAQAQTFRSAAFRRWAGMYPLPTKMADPFTKPVETPLYQERVIVARKDQYRDITSQGPKYEAPRSASSGGIFSGLSGMADAAKKNYASVKKTASETMGQGKKVDGKRTKQELHAAAQYEEKRQKEEKQKLAREDERRRAERAERTAAKRL
jgi:YidC/Oxa1 family membrane protein insertase